RYFGQVQVRGANCIVSGETIPTRDDRVWRVARHTHTHTHTHTHPHTHTHTNINTIPQKRTHRENHTSAYTHTHTHPVSISLNLPAFLSSKKRLLQVST